MNKSDPYEEYLQNIRDEKFSGKAGFSNRLLASVIDLFILTIFLKILGVGYEPKDGGSLMVLNSIGISIFIAYYFFTDWILKGTLGKKLLRLVVCDENGERMKIENALLRLLTRALTIVTMPFSLLMIAIRKDKRTIHDIISATYVMRR